MTQDEMVGWHHLINGHESEQTAGDGEGQGSLTCCSSWVTAGLQPRWIQGNFKGEMESESYEKAYLITDIKRD